MVRSFSILSSKGSALSALLAAFCLIGMIELGIRYKAEGWAAVRDPWRYHTAALLNTPLVEAHPDPRVGWVLAKNQASFYKGKVFSTNQYGFRDTDWKVQKDERTRLAVLGRSYSMGTGVNDGEDWPAVLEGILESPEVLNFSVEAYSLLQLEAVYHRFVKPFKVDYVLLPFFLGEVFSPVAQDPIKLRNGLRKRLSVPYWVDHLYFPEWLQLQFWVGVKQHLNQKWGDLHSGNPEILVRGAYPEAIVRRLAQQTKKDGTHLILIPMPHLVPLPEETILRVKSLLSKAQSLTNLTVLEILHHTQELYSVENTVLPGDPHPNAFIHKELATEISKPIARIIRSRNSQEEQH